ncbi:hypothetical protein [Salinibacterium sp. ZJ450]|uniref:hypothetical protein n=1 Tax=Salinibacterium sp. ZJ450 TaxID=2708338 RepID=UPI001422E4F3|nr:hypothetical protein [Salinibacterium sp. ZJ450]
MVRVDDDATTISDRRRPTVIGLPVDDDAERTTLADDSSPEHTLLRDRRVNVPTPAPLVEDTGRMHRAPEVGVGTSVGYAPRPLATEAPIARQDFSVAITPIPGPDDQRARQTDRRTAATALVAIAATVVLVTGAAGLGIVVLLGI